jgi:hypothetical protein
MRRALVISAVLLTGCTATPARTASPPSTTPPTPSVAPSAGITREAAAAQYLKIGEPLNRVIGETNKQCEQDRGYYTGDSDNANPPAKRLANLKDCDRKVAAALRTSISATRAALWPGEVKADIEKLLKFNEAQVYTLERLAGAPNEDAYLKLVDSLPPDDGSADIVRARLGLPTRSPT